MRQRTELMNAILTNEEAQRIIDYVSPIYGDSYVGLWLFQAIGIALGDVRNIAIELREEANPTSADLLLTLYEKHYSLPLNKSLNKEQRQARLLDKILSRGPCNPTRLAAAVSAALGGAEVDITENIAKNTFLVNIRQVVEDTDIVKDVLDRRKPAHLIYQIRVALQIVANPDIKVGVAMTHSEQYKVEVKS